MFGNEDGGEKGGEGGRGRTRKSKDAVDAPSLSLRLQAAQKTVSPSISC